MIDIDEDCESEEAFGICPFFVSTPEDEGRNTTLR